MSHSWRAGWRRAWSKWPRCEAVWAIALGVGRLTLFQRGGRDIVRRLLGVEVLFRDQLLFIKLARAVIVQLLLF